MLLTTAVAVLTECTEQQPFPTGKKMLFSV